MDYDRLLEFCTTKKQEELVKAVDACHGNVSGAAKMLGLTGDPTNHRRTLRDIKARAAKGGYSPEANIDHPVAEGYELKGYSHFTKTASGEPIWIKATAGAQQQADAFKKFVEELCEPVRGLSPLVAPPEVSNDKLLSIYPIGDQHHGMYAEAEQTGDEYNTDISAKLLTSHVDYLASQAPNSAHALLLDVGDFHHANCSNMETPQSRHRMHTTASYGKVMKSGAMALVHCTLRLLEKHQNVTVWIMPGNHNPDAAFATAMALSFYFHNEPRVTVDLGNSAFKYMRFGKNLIGSHHGDGVKGSNLPLVMAVDRPEDWAASEYRVWHCGHIHHKTVKEEPGCDVETHRTLAPSNDWDHKKGYRSKREMQRIDYHFDLGECSRQPCHAKTIKAFMEAA